MQDGPRGAQPSGVGQTGTSEGRDIVFLFDGTWKDGDRASGRKTNVWRTFQAADGAVGTGESELAGRATLLCSGGDLESVDYEPGVGTGNLNRLRGGLLGMGLTAKVRDAYRDLAFKYKPGDRIFLFGYSRGAYTARSLAGLIGLCGIPRNSSPSASGDELAKRAMKAYRKRDKCERAEACRAFAERWAHRDPDSRNVLREVWFVGVWDTVGSLGVPITGLRWAGGFRNRFHDVRLGPHVRHAYHAVAIHERRRAYKPTLWKHPPGACQKVEQAWFPGVHSDVGGGGECRGLSDSALLWIWAKAHVAGLRLNPQRVRCIAPNAESRGNRRFLQKFFPRYRRRIGSRTPTGGPEFAGEVVHFSAVEWLESRTCENGREAAGRSRELVSALRSEEKRIPVVPAMRAEENPALLQRLHRYDATPDSAVETAFEGGTLGESPSEVQAAPPPSASAEPLAPKIAGDVPGTIASVDHGLEPPRSVAGVEEEVPKGGALTRRGVSDRVGRLFAVVASDLRPVGASAVLFLASVSAGLAAFALAYPYVRQSDFLVTAAGFVSLGLAVQLLLHFGKSLTEACRRLVLEVRRTVRDAKREWKADPHAKRQGAS